MRRWDNTIDMLDIMKTSAMDDKTLLYESLCMPHWSYYINPADVDAIKSVVTSARLQGNIDKRERIVREIMAKNNFVRFAGGTNRTIFRHTEDDTIVAKVAIDRVGMKDNPAEMETQRYLMPFCAKMFQTTPCGTIGFSERVLPIKNRKEFAIIADDVFEVINALMGTYVMDDIGTKYFMNWGIAKGRGPVLLDYPYVYRLDYNKLFCDRILLDGVTRCNGLIDYDDGFNILRCERCGKTFPAITLKKDNEDNQTVIHKGGSTPMKISLIRDGKVVKESNSSDTITSVAVARNNHYSGDAKHPQIKVSIRRNVKPEQNTVPERETPVFNVRVKRPDKENTSPKEEVQPEVPPIQMVKEPVNDMEETPENTKRIIVNDKVSIRDDVKISESAPELRNDLRMDEDYVCRFKDGNSVITAQGRITKVLYDGFEFTTNYVDKETYLIHYDDIESINIVADVKEEEEFELRNNLSYNKTYHCLYADNDGKLIEVIGHIVKALKDGIILEGERQQDGADVERFTIPYIDISYIVSQLPPSFIELDMKLGKSYTIEYYDRGLLTTITGTATTTYYDEEADYNGIIISINDSDEFVRILFRDIYEYNEIEVKENVQDNLQSSNDSSESGKQTDADVPVKEELNISSSSNSGAIIRMSSPLLGELNSPDEQPAVKID